jgi:FixJ family two-component response regulator
MRSRRVPTVPPVTITDAERAELQRRVRAHTTLQRAAKRARIVLLAADGLPNRQIAPMVGMNQHTVAQWRRRFEAERLAGSPTASGRAAPWSTTTTSGCGSWPR